ncbi:beaten path IV [Musca autumnalis]|uniref:beaten path IV n=1 Tax=Musca autumnalis TaxID=221902 RepID=UPI003CF50F7A
MNLSFDTRIFVLICCLLQGLAGLRLIKVSIPSYKMRGESTFMECQYELNRSKSLYGGLHRNRNHHSHGQYQQQQRHQYRQYGGGHTGGSIVHYDDNDDIPQHKRTHTHSQQSYKQQRQQQQQQYQYQHRQPYYQSQIQTHKALWQDMSNIRSRNSNGASSSYHQQHLQYPFLPQKQKRQYNPEYPTLPPSPYGHSVYRGRSQMSSISHSSSSSSSSSSQSSPAISSSGSHTSNYGGRVGASTYTGRTYSNTGTGVFGSSSSYGHHDDNFGDSNEREEQHIDEDNSHDEEDDFDNEADSDGDEDEHDEEEGEDLYAIKWYKDNEEFYRFVPKANPPKTSYRVDGVRVIEEHSDSSRVLLRGLTINSTGLYRCEISAEAPSFASVQGEGQMDVVYLPRDGPHIKGQQFQYQIGEILNLNCSSGKSHPASHLQWFINDQPVLDEQYLIHYNDTVHRHGLITSTLGLEMTVDARHFQNGAMRVKCLASISPVLWKGDKESVLQRRPGIIDNREAMLLVRSSSTGLHHHHWYGRHDNGTLMLLRLLTTMAILMKLCQLLHLHRGFT